MKEEKGNLRRKYSAQFHLYSVHEITSFRENRLMVVRGYGWGGSGYKGVA